MTSGHKIAKNLCAPFIHSFIVDEWETTNLNRLTGGTATSGYYSGAAMSWTYDPFGNRTAQNFGGSPVVSMPSSSTVELYYR